MAQIEGIKARWRYLENHFEKRLDPTKLVPGAKSVISLVLQLLTQNNTSKICDSRPKIAKYALWTGLPLCNVKDKLKKFMSNCR